MNTSMDVYLFYVKIGATHCQKHPELRIGQLMDNFSCWLRDKGIDIFYVDNDRFVELIQEYLKGGAK